MRTISSVLAALWAIPLSALTLGPAEALACGGDCEVVCANIFKNGGCDKGHHYDALDFRCHDDHPGSCDDGYYCSYGPCGGPGQRQCNQARCDGCSKGAHYDTSTAKCQASCVEPSELGRDDGFSCGSGPASSGPCGWAGERTCSVAPSCSSGTSYDAGSAHCELPQAQCATKVVVDASKPLDLTFLVATDLHAGSGDVKIDSIKENVFWMNRLDTALTGRARTSGDPMWPSGSRSGVEYIGDPLAVVLTGDLTHFGQPEQLGAFRTFYEPELYSKDRGFELRIPVYPGLGNHDTQTQCTKPNDCAGRMKTYMDRRVGTYRTTSDTGLAVDLGIDHDCALATSFDRASKNYSWDWGALHLIQLNTWAGDDRGNRPRGDGLKWLIRDLKVNAAGGKRVVIFQHYGFDNGNSKRFTSPKNDSPGDGDDIWSYSQVDPSWMKPDGTAVEPDGTVLKPTWWSDPDRQAFQSALAGYNVVAIIVGHNHAARVDLFAGYDVLQGSTGGVGGKGGFFAVRITEQYLDAVHLSWDPKSMSLSSSGGSGAFPVPSLPKPSLHLDIDSAGLSKGRIHNRDGWGACLDLRRDLKRPPAVNDPVQIWSCSGRDTNQWWQTPANGTIQLGGLCLTAPASGNVPVLGACGGSASQRWTVDDRIRSSGSGLCLDVSGGSSSDGADVILAPCTGSASQTWKH